MSYRDPLTFYRLNVDDPSDVKEEETNDLLGDEVKR